MTDVNIAQLAELSAQQPEALLERLKQANVIVESVDTPLTPKQKEAVLALLKPAKKRAKGKLTLGSSAATDVAPKDAEPTPASRSKVRVTVKKARAIKKPVLKKPEPVAPPAEPAPTPKAPEDQATQVTTETNATEKTKSQDTPTSDAATPTETPTTPTKKQDNAADATPTATKDKEHAAPGHKGHKKKAAGKTEYLLNKDYEAAKSKRRKRKGSHQSTHKEIQSLKQDFEKPVEAVVHTVAIPESIRVGDLARKMSVNATAVIKTMMNMGAMVTINQLLDQDTATLVVEEMGHRAVATNDNAMEEDLMDVTTAKQGDVITRAPVVTIMGHVDHGKTSLLDTIRATQVVKGEAGGITQHIGAYQVQTPNGAITFLDTPGHAAFTAMRARGAQCTDIVVLVVAADDGVMPQTIEAIQHARAAEVPIIVAVNKIDKPEADPERVTNELSGHGVSPESWGGDTIFQSISAKTGQGIDELLASILLQAEVLELKAPSKGPAKGIIVESRLDRGRGVVATALVQSGTLNQGDCLLAGKAHGRIRALLDDQGQRIKTAGPSMPVEVLGLSEAPAAGEECFAVESEKKAREIALFRQGRYRDVKLAKQQSAKLENIFSRMQEGEASALNIILKTDVQGSMEAILDALNKLSTDEVKVNTIASGVGGITESDVQLAIASQAIILGFNVRADHTAKALVNREGVDLHYYSVIYQLIDEVKAAMSGLLSPEIKETILGVASVKEVFKSSKIGAIAGCQVIDGTIVKGCQIRVLRDHVVIFTGELESLRRFKEEAQEVKMGTECGIGVKDYNDVKPKDQIECFRTTEHKRQL